jgi:predicted membrane protein DUF2127
MPRQRTPKGVVLLAIVCVLVAGSLLWTASLVAVAPPATLRSFGFRADPGVSLRLTGLCFFGGAGVFVGAAGYGLWRLKRWAHYFATGSVASTLMREVITLSTSIFGRSTPNAHLNLAASILLVAALCYLLTPGVRAAFGFTATTVGRQ